MPHRDRAIILAFVVVLAVLAGGILLPAARPAALQVVATPTPTASPEAPVVAYRDGIVGRPSSLTPLTQRTRADRDIVALVFRGLVGLGSGQKLVPDLAEPCKISDAGRTYTFTIRPDAQWDDGTPVTADDVVFTVAMLKDADYTGPAAASWSDVTAKALDPKTVEFTLGKPIGGFIELARQPLLPKHLLADVPVTDLADSDFARSPVGNGPYRIIERDLDRVVLEPSDGYAGPVDPGATPEPTPGADGSPAPGGSASASPSPTATAAPTDEEPVDLAASGLARIELRFYDDEEALAAAYRAGEVDAASGLDPGTAAGLMDVAGTRLLRYPSSIFTSLTFNLRADHPRFRDLRFRRAVTMAIDREKIVEDIYLGNAALAETPIPPASWAFSSASSRLMPFDVKRATAELKKSGWKKTAKGWVAPKQTKPFTLKLLALDPSANPVSNAVAKAIARDLTAFGIKTTVTALPASTFIQRVQDHDFDAVVLDANIGLDPDLYPLLASTQAGPGGGNVSGIQSADLDKLLEDARKPGTTVARKARYAKLQDYLSTQQVMPPLLFRDHVVAYRSTVDGPQPRELGDLSDRFWDVLTWRLAANP
jgi:peptide/nickel transport system substrate-binding protein